MKRILIGTIVVLAAMFAGLQWYQHTYYGGTAYYIQIRSVGTKIAPQDDKGNVYIDYRYDQLAATETGATKRLVFNANKDRPLRLHAYLKLTYNAKRGVTAWTALPAAKVPAKAKAALQNVDR